MATVLTQLPATWTTEDNAGRLDEYLRGKGRGIAGVSISGQTVAVDLETEADASAVLADVAAYQPAPTQRELRLKEWKEDGYPIFKAIAQKSRADRTNMERAVLSLAAAAYLAELEQ